MIIFDFFLKFVRCSGVLVNPKLLCPKKSILYPEKSFRITNKVFCIPNKVFCVPKKVFCIFLGGNTEETSSVKSYALTIRTGFIHPRVPVVPQHLLHGRNHVTSAWRGATVET